MQYNQSERAAINKRDTADCQSHTHNICTHRGHPRSVSELHVERHLKYGVLKGVFPLCLAPPIARYSHMKLVLHQADAVVHVSRNSSHRDAASLASDLSPGCEASLPPASANTTPAFLFEAGYLRAVPRSSLFRSVILLSRSSACADNNFPDNALLHAWNQQCTACNFQYDTLIFGASNYAASIMKVKSP